ncbi:MAG TPA: hypothetical protein VGF20_07375, partial [Candidatus Acidoferrum sp.]
MHSSNLRLLIRIAVPGLALALLGWPRFVASNAKPALQQSAAPISTPPYPTIQQPPAQRTGLNIVVLDAAHGGTDPGARGA